MVEVGKRYGVGRAIVLEEDIGVVEADHGDLGQAGWDIDLDGEVRSKAAAQDSGHRLSLVDVELGIAVARNIHPDYDLLAVGNLVSIHRFAPCWVMMVQVPRLCRCNYACGRTRPGSNRD